MYPIKVDLNLKKVEHLWASVSDVIKKGGEGVSLREGRWRVDTVEGRWKVGGLWGWKRMGRGRDWGAGVGGRWACAHSPC